MILKYLEHNKFLWWFAGEDPFILKSCNKEVRIKFSLIGLLVVLVMVITFISISYGFYELMESYYIGLFIGVYSAILVMFLYMFILYTVTKDVLPYKKGKKIEISFSYVIRFGFLFALGLVVSQPIEYNLFSDKVDRMLNDTIVKSIKEKNVSLNTDYSERAEHLIQFNYSSDIKEQLEELNNEKKTKLKKFASYQYSRNFFIEKMIIMDKHLIYIWVFSVLFIILFSSPIFLKIRIDLNTNYYKNKRMIQRDLLEWHFKKFLKSYNSIIKKSFPESELSYKQIYTDPPYNTQRITFPKMESQEEFTKWLLYESS